MPGETVVREGFLEEMTFWGQNFPDTASWWGGRGKETRWKDLPGPEVGSSGYV